MRKRYFISLILPMLINTNIATAGEHGGSAVKEHGGAAVKEHGGGAVKEHKLGSAEKSSLTVSAKTIKNSLMQYINTHVNKKKIFTHIDKDNKDNKLLLKFIKIHDPVRFMKKKGQYFACTDFSASEKSKKIYDLDFWLAANKKTGKLEVVSVKVHKDPVATAWQKHPRYTFKGEEIVDVK